MSPGIRDRGIPGGLKHNGDGEGRQHDEVSSVLPLGTLSGGNHLPNCQGTVLGMYLERSRTEPENKLSV